MNPHVKDFEVHIPLGGSAADFEVRPVFAPHPELEGAAPNAARQSALDPQPAN